MEKYCREIISTLKRKRGLSRSFMARELIQGKDFMGWQREKLQVQYIKRRNYETTNIIGDYAQRRSATYR